MKDMNFYSTFIEVADDFPVKTAEIPKTKNGSKSIPVLQFELIANNPYKYTQEDVLFEVFAQRNNIVDAQRVVEREKFFSKGQPCLRTSSIGKRYGWGIHNDPQGKVALYAIESDVFQRNLLEHIQQEIKTNSANYYLKTSFLKKKITIYMPK